MGQHVADVNLVSIIMQSGDQSNFVPADIEDGKFSNLIRVREEVSQSGEVGEAALADNPIPARERWSCLRMLLRKLIQALPCDDMHDPGAGVISTRLFRRLRF